MRPILLKGHERSITYLKYNRDGDLIFTCSKDHKPNVWFSSTGERLGTYNGHEGAVWALDVNSTSTLLLTASADTSVRLWDVQTGKTLFVFKHLAPVRGVEFAEGDRQFLTVGDKSLGQEAAIFIYDLAEDLSQQNDQPVATFRVGRGVKVNQARWGPGNNLIFAACDDNSVRIFDVASGEEIDSIEGHAKQVNTIEFTPDKTMFITASADQSARLYDTETRELKQTFEADRPLNWAVVSPFYLHVLVGGGQAAADVTTSSSRQGKFEALFYSIPHAELYGSVKGHFGPINTIGFSPDGKSFATGAEDGYIRLHHIDSDFYKVLQHGEDERKEAN